MASTAHVLMWLDAFVTYTLLMCPKLTQYQTHKHYIAGSTKPWSPSASWVRGISMGGPIALWTKDYNGFCDVSCGPLQRLAWFKAVSHNGTCSRPSDVAGKSFRENDFKFDNLFYTTNTEGHWCLQSYFKSYCEKKVRDMDMNLVLWIWSTRTRTKVLVLTHFFSTRTRAKQSTRTRTQDLCTRPNPDQNRTPADANYPEQGPKNLIIPSPTNTHLYPPIRNWIHPSRKDDKEEKNNAGPQDTPQKGLLTEQITDHPQE